MLFLLFEGTNECRLCFISTTKRRITCAANRLLHRHLSGYRIVIWQPNTHNKHNNVFYGWMYNVSLCVLEISDKCMQKHSVCIFMTGESVGFTVSSKDLCEINNSQSSWLKTTVTSCLSSLTKIPYRLEHTHAHAICTRHYLCKLWLEKMFSAFPPWCTLHQLFLCFLCTDDSSVTIAWMIPFHT